MTRRLDRKLAAIAEGRSGPDDFVLADAKDADMAFGAAAPGRGRTRPEYLDAMRALIAQGELDVMLTSAANGERLAGELGDEVTLAVRGNDTTDIWLGRGATYAEQPSRPF